MDRMSLDTSRQPPGSAQRGRCGLFRSVALVTDNLHIGLELGYLDQKGLALPQSLGASQYLALCLLDSNKKQLIHTHY